MDSYDYFFNVFLYNNWHYRVSAAIGFFGVDRKPSIHLEIYGVATTLYFDYRYVLEGQLIYTAN